MIIDLVTSPNSDPIKGLEIKALEKTDSPYEYRITDKDVISALERVTPHKIKEAYIVECGEIEEEWAIVAYYGIPLSRQFLEDDSCVFDVTSMEGTPADLL